MYRILSGGSKGELELKREQACSDSECVRKLRNNVRAGDNQEKQDSLLCRINLANLTK